MTELNLDTRNDYLTAEEIKSILKATPIPCTKDDLEVRLQNCRKGARPVTIVACTKPSNMRVKDSDGNPLPDGFREGKGKSEVWHLRKRGVVNGFVQYDYEASMNRALVKDGKEPTFEVGDRSYGVRREVEGKTRCCLVDHTPVSGEHAGQPTVYLSVFVRRSLGYHYYLDTDGSFVDPNIVHQYMGAKKPETIVVRDYTLDNIERVAIDGLTYIVIGTPAYDEWQRECRHAA